MLQPSSKKKAYERQESYVGLEQIELHHTYLIISFLASHKGAIEKSLFHRQADLYNLKLDIVFFDATTFHFESQK